MDKKFIKTSFLYIFGSFAIQGLRFLTLPFFSRFMDPGDYALMSSYEAWISIVLILVGMQSYACINNAYIELGKESLNSFVSSISFLAIFTGLLTSIVTFILRDVLETVFEIKSFFLQMGVIQAFFTYYLNAIVTKYRVTERPYAYLLYSIMHSLISMGLGIGLVLLLPNQTYEGRIYASLIAAVMVGGVALYNVYARGRIVFNTVYVKYALMFSAPLIFHALSGIIMGKADQIMLLKISGNYEMGIYSYGTNYAHILYVLYTACNLAYTPTYYKLKASCKEKEIIKFNGLYMKVFTALSGTFILVLPEIIKLMSGEKYYAAIRTVPVLSCAFVINFLYTFPVNFEFYHKKTKYTAYSTIFAAMLNIVLNLYFINLWNSFGAALATCISTGIQLALHLFAAKKLIGNYEMPLKPFAKSLLFLGLIAILYYCLVDRMILRWIAAVIFFFIGIRYFWNQLNKD